MSVLTSNPTTTTFRDLVAAISPPWLKGPVGSRLMYSMAIQFDALADGQGYSIRFALPTYSAPDSLPHIIEDRQIDRGPNEPEASIEDSLRKWLDLWRTAGSARAVIRALTSYFTGTTIVSGPTPPVVETVNDETVDSFNVWDVGPSDPPAHTASNPANWNWDGLPIPGRAWVVIFNGPWTRTIKWGGGRRWGDGCTWGGSSATAADGIAIRARVKKWKAAGCYIPQIIVAFDSTWFQPALPPGDPKLPDGTWARWGKVVTVGGVRQYVPARTGTAIYLGDVS